MLFWCGRVIGTYFESEGIFVAIKRATFRAILIERKRKSKKLIQERILYKRIKDIKNRHRKNLRICI